MRPFTSDCELQMVRMKVDRRFAEFEWEFSTLDAMRQVLELEIPGFADRQEQRRFAELKAKGWDGDEAERQQVWQEADHLREQVIPRFARGPLTIALWAAMNRP
jgi:hypothetical protein